MSKRFTDTEIWDKEWFMLLKPKQKCLVKYVRDKCDIAGVWSPNWILASTYIGEKVTQSELLEIDRGAQFLLTDEKKIFCIGFISFQYGDALNEKSPVHKKIIDILIRYKVKGNTLFDTLYSKVSDTQMEEEEDMDKEVDKVVEEEKEKENKQQAHNQAGGEAVPEPAKTITNPFSENFSPHWQRWKEYKRDQHRFVFKSADSEQSALNDLVRVSKGDEVTAAAIIQQSIAKGWKGLFELKTEENASGKNGKPGTGKATSSGINQAYAKFHRKEPAVASDA